MPVIVSEIIAAKRSDAFCQKVFNTMHQAKLFFFAGKDGVLRRRNPSIPELNEIVDPDTLCPRLLNLPHYLRMAGNPDPTRMFAHLWQTYYCPLMAAYISSTVLYCPHCVRNLFHFIHRNQPMRLFPAEQPL